MAFAMKGEDANSKLVKVVSDANIDDEDSDLGTFPWKNTVVPLDFVQIRGGGGALAKFLSHFEEVLLWSLKESILKVRGH